jgi:AraC-like DNA-binding protein
MLAIEQPVEPKEQNQSSLASEVGRIIARFADSDGAHDTPISGLAFHRWSQPTAASCNVCRPIVSFIAQGEKRVTLGDEARDYESDHYLLVSFDLPIISEVRRATPEEPFLSLSLDLDLGIIADLMASTDDRLSRDVPTERGLAVGRLTPELGDALLRLARLLEAPHEVPVLAPLIEREIFFRLLVGEHGARLRHLVAVDSQSRHIARAIAWLRENYKQPLRIDALAKIAAMSTSTFHLHFKAITAMSPLQFQKHLRLQEARRLMLTQAIDAADAGHQVGYESASQFSREYRRLFGAPPRRDLALLRGRPHEDIAIPARSASAI